MFSVLLLCVIFCACAALAYREYGRKSGHPLPPTLSGALPIIGNAALLIGDTTDILVKIKDIMMKECMEKGGVICLYIGMDLHYFITDPDDALTVANTCLQKHYIYNFAKPWLGEGLFTSSGPIWQRHRKLLNPAFSTSVIHGFLDIFNQMSKQLLNDVETHVGKHYFDHAAYITVINVQTVCKTTFALNDADLKDFANKYMRTSAELMHLIFYRFLHVWLHSDFIYKLSGLQGKEKGLIKTLNDLVNPVIYRKMEDMKKIDDAETEFSKLSAAGSVSSNSPGHETTLWHYGSRFKPLINLLIGLQNDDALTEKEIREEVDTALITAFDTTSNFMTYLMVIIGYYPKVQQRMYEEIMEVLGADKDVEKDDLKRLVYIEAVIKETLRLFPIGPVLSRYVDRDVKLRNYTMRAGSQCIICTLGIHRDPRYGEDVEDFRPERWLDPAVSSLGNTAFFGFSSGKRSCIGRTYTMTSMKVTLSHFIRRYKVTGDMNKLKFKLDFLLKPTSAAISIEYRN